MRNRLLVWILISALLCAVLPFGVSAAEEKNLAEGLSYGVASGEPVSMSYGNYSDGDFAYDSNEGQLTDGNTASAPETNTNVWYRAFRGGSRIVTFDLGDISAVSRVTASFLHNKNADIYAPRYIKVSLSENGTDYEQTAEYSTDYPLHQDIPELYSAEIELDDTYAARYVKVEYSCDAFSYCDEIAIFGTKELSGSEKKLRPKSTPDGEGYLSDLEGYEDTVKLYGKALTEEDLLPYVAYLDSNGNIAGRMFDSAVFALMPENGSAASEISSDMDAWEDFLDGIFAENLNLQALDSVVGRVYSELELKKEFGIFLTIPYPAVTEAPFGDIDGDGNDEYCRTSDERSAVVKWYAEKAIKTFKANKYENLELAGFCWGERSIDVGASADEIALVQSMNRLVSRKGYSAVFESDYLAVGYDRAEEAGFAASVMAPNLVLEQHSYFEKTMLSEYAVTVYNKGLGAVVESADVSAFRGDGYLAAGGIYESYLYYGMKQGYMNGFNMYSVSAEVINELCNADIVSPKGRYLRRLYDITYSYIHGIYKNGSPVITIGDMELIVGDKSMVSEVVINDPDSYWDDIIIDFPQKPAHGKVAAASGKKSIVYSPDEGFAGEDVFTVIAHDGFNSSAEITVRVTVTRPEDLYSGNDGQGTDDMSSLGKAVDEDPPVWLVPVLVVLALAMVGVAIVTVAKKTVKDNKDNK